MRSPTSFPVPVPAAEVLAVAREYVEAGRLEAAERMLGHVLAVRPGEAGALHLRATVAQRRGRLAEATGLLRAALAGGETAAVLRDLAELLRVQGAPAEALAAARAALRHDPGDPLSLFVAAMAHYDSLEIDACIAAARAAIGQRPDMAAAHMKLAQALLLRGESDADWAEGWAEYEWRYRIPGASSPLPEAGHAQWDGAPLPDRPLLLIADQGYGDCVQFARYLPWVRARCPLAVVACSAEIAPLLAWIAPGIPRVTRWEEAPSFAAFCPLSGLPRLHGTTPATIPGGVPYLHPDPDAVARWRARLPDGRLRVGLAWAGRPVHPNDANRSMPLAGLAPLAAVADVAFVALMKGADPTGWPGPAPLVTPTLDAFDDTAGLIAALDVVIAVDTSAIHIAGAMGKPAWAMLPMAPDWRWRVGRADSAWYPSVRLFRCAAPRAWGPVVAEVAAALAGFTAP